MSKIELNWHLVANKTPQGFLELSNGCDRVWQGPLKYISVDETGHVTLEMEWCATIAVTSEGKPDPNDSWQQATKRTMEFTNGRLPFQFETTPKGECVKFAHNRLYFKNCLADTEPIGT